MNKVIVGMMSVLVLGASVLLAQETKAADSSQMQASQLVEVGNKICPVSGNKVGEMGPAIKHEYNGKIYNLCCGMCPSKFDKDPAKYSKIADDEVASVSK